MNFLTAFSDQLLQSLSENQIPSRQGKIGSYNWLRPVNAVCFFTQRVSHIDLTFF